MIALQRAAVGVLAAIAFAATAANAANAPASPGEPGASTRSARFSQLGARTPLALRGDGESATLDFGSRSDELVTRAVFRFRYVGSPALAPGLSHIRVALNGDTIGTLPFAAATIGTLTERSVEVDPRLLIGFNKLVVTLIAREGDGAADPARPGVWAEISSASELELSVRALVPADDLAILPEPFFDRHDQRRVTVPMIFGERPSAATLRAAAVVASWFGQLARWRGVRTPVTFGVPGTGHSIAFLTNDDRPAFLASLPQATGPELRLMTNPADARAKLLVVMGRTGDDLKVAADALALGGSAMSGATVKVKRVDDKGPLAAYDVPAWVALDRAVKLGDLLDWPQQLEASGRLPDLDPVRVDLRVPPDLATWRGQGVAMTLKLQYTPPPCVSDGYLDVAVNDQLIDTLKLRIANEPVADTQEVFIPFYRVRARSQLTFGFHFGTRDDSSCRDARAPVMKAAVLPESTIDFSGYPHFVRMPNLAHFASVGFPFTRRADLSETVVVLPERLSTGDVEAMLELMARMGEATGHPATRVRIATPRDAAALEGADLLVIGALPQQALLEAWGERLPVALSGSLRRVGRSAARTEGVFDWLGMGAPMDNTVAREVSFEGTGPIAALYGFESPVTRGRSVVAVTAVVPDQLTRVIDALDDLEMRRAIKGSAALVFPNKVESALVGATYHVGFMPPWAGAGQWLAQHPEIAGVLATLILLAMGFAAYVAKTRFAAWRKGRRR